MAPEPPVGGLLNGVTFFEGWTEPRALTNTINTDGWEDSAFISHDGETLFFGYSPLNYYQFTLMNSVVSGPYRPGQHGDYFDIYEAQIANGIWAVTNSDVNDPDPFLHEAAIGVNADETVIAFIRFNPEGNIYTSRKEGGIWNTPVRLPAPINTPCVEDNPHLSEDGKRLYFDSNFDYAAGTGCVDESGGLKRDIYVSDYVGGSWTVPVPVQGIPNTLTNAWQAFVDQEGEYLYWSGACSEISGGSCLYRTRRQPDGSYDEQKLIAQATTGAPGEGDVIAVGEMSITGDGRFLYFVYIEYYSTEWKISIGVVRKGG